MPVSVREILTARPDHGVPVPTGKPSSLAFAVVNSASSSRPWRRSSAKRSSSFAAGPTRRGSVQTQAIREVTVEAAATRSPLMFVHGAWLSSQSWDTFAGYFRDRGYDVSAPEWPRKDGDVESLRENTEAIEGLGLTEIVDHYELQIRALDSEPILIGHSFGGLVVELLLDRGLGRAGVAMSPAPPKGILVLPF